MDSLMANYGSSGEEDDGAPAREPLFSSLPSPNTFASSSVSSSVPPPKLSSSSSLFASLPSLRSSHPPHYSSSSLSSSSSSSSLFSSIPPPKSGQITNTESQPKRVVKFRPPLNPYTLKPSTLDDDEDDEEAVKANGHVKELSSPTERACLKSKPFLLPPPKHTLYLSPAHSSSAVQRSAIDISTGSSTRIGKVQLEDSCLSYDNPQEYYVNSVPTASGRTATGCENHVGREESLACGIYNSDGVGEDEQYTYSGNESYINSTNYANNSLQTPTSAVPTLLPATGSSDYQWNYSNPTDSSRGSAPGAYTEMSDDSVVRIAGKRGRNEVPELVEVKQDELMSNRPREDQVRLTGIAFGPSYQSASSVKGKPSKLHRRKHQIGSLYYDMKQKEMELAERRARGLLSKAQTQGKYGW